MTKHVITGKDHIFGPWVLEKMDGGQWFNGRGTTIGLFNDATDRISAAVLYEGANGASILLHCTGEGRDWLNREFLWYVFHYPFEELGVRKIISPVESTNEACIRFIKHIGFNLEATLKDASPKGNLLLFTLERENCKWLSLKGKYRGASNSSDKR